MCPLTAEKRYKNMLKTHQNGCLDTSKFISLLFFFITLLLFFLEHATLFSMSKVYFNYFFFLISQRCAPASIRLMDNEQFKFGKFPMIL